MDLFRVMDRMNYRVSAKRKWVETLDDRELGCSVTGLDSLFPLVNDETWLHKGEASLQIKVKPVSEKGKKKKKKVLR